MSYRENWVDFIKRTNPKEYEQILREDQARLLEFINKQKSVEPEKKVVFTKLLIPGEDTHGTSK